MLFPPSWAFLNLVLDWNQVFCLPARGLVYCPTLTWYGKGGFSRILLLMHGKLIIFFFPLVSTKGSELMPVFVLYIGENGKVTETSGKKMSQEIISSSPFPQQGWVWTSTSIISSTMQTTIGPSSYFLGGGWGNLCRLFHKCWPLFSSFWYLTALTWRSSSWKFSLVQYKFPFSLHYWLDLLTWIPPNPAID